MNEQTIRNLIEILGHVKDLRRSGWLKRNIPAPESDGDHMFSTAFLALVLAPDYKINKLHCLELALTHDLQEIIAGDPVPGEKTEQQKYDSELIAITEISQKLNMPCLVEWFKEFEARETEEARFVKSLDKLDTVLTAAYYDSTRQSEPKVFEEFSQHGLNCLHNMPSCVSENACEIIHKIKI
ncbi:MAG: HD domain-containing protein [Alphaproteobacteria bacterium]|nr:HD domain-containing protein [Alphaproteobacteria bacterium]